MNTNQLQSIVLVDTATTTPPPSSTDANTQTQPKSSMSLMIPIMIAFLGYIWIMSRRQKKQEQELKNKLNALVVGDRVLLLGGIYGNLTKVNETTVLVEIAKNVIVEYNKSSVVDIIVPPKEDKKETSEAK